MRTALITTTINQPHVLHLYRKFGPHVQFFVAGDLKTPDPDSDAPWTYIHPQDQDVWKCSMPIGWNTISRRNIALLEAVKWGADIIVSIDDDNIPLGGYFAYINWMFSTFNGLSVSGYGGWFDVGQMLKPVAPHRGFPLDKIGMYQVGFATNAKIGVAAGICIGDPDVDAVTRIANRPAPITVDNVSALLRDGIVVDLGTRTVFNSQNTAIIRELAPAFFMIPGIGRYDDIFASLICQRVMRERNLHVHFGPPFVWQQRNAHNLLTDLKNEMWGMENILRFAEVLDTIDLAPDKSVLEHVGTIWRALSRVNNFLPEQSWKAALAFLDDMESVL